MPFAIVEILGSTNGEGLLVVPETWLVRERNGVSFVYWPDTKRVTNVNLLLADDQSSPMDVWEKRLCKIVCDNISSLTLAAKTLQILRKRKATVNATTTGRTALDAKKTLLVSGHVIKCEQETVKLSDSVPEDSFNACTKVQDPLSDPSNPGPKVGLEQSGSSEFVIKEEEEQELFSMLEVEQQSDPFEDIAKIAKFGTIAPSLRSSVHDEKVNEMTAMEQDETAEQGLIIEEEEIIGEEIVQAEDVFGRDALVEQQKEKHTHAVRCGKKDKMQIKQERGGCSARLLGSTEREWNDVRFHAQVGMQQEDK
uniref:Uncharacterized protein n=1 Tax=Anopheles epiroticus TaxID=199890 RepID=A0A182P5B2_9DIPT